VRRGGGGEEEEGRRKGREGKGRRGGRRGRRGGGWEEGRRKAASVPTHLHTRIITITHLHTRIIADPCIQDDGLAPCAVLVFQHRLRTHLPITTFHSRCPVVYI
jgi:hypothetical protein